MKRKIIITGSTDGIGKLTALKLAEKGNKIYVHGRSQQKVAETIDEIKKAAQNENIYGFVADLSELDAVKQLSEQIKTEVSHLDVLINNAGIYNSPVTANSRGIDIRFAVNYLARYILGNELSPLLSNSSAPRIINLSSAAQSSVSLDALSGKVRLSESEAYAQSKLAITTWSLSLAKQLKNISIIAVNPGSLLNTKMVKEAFGNHWSSADKGADILFDLAVSEKYKGITGKYYDNDRGNFGNAHPDAYNENLSSKLFELTKNII